MATRIATALRTPAHRAAPAAGLCIVAVLSIAPAGAQRSDDAAPLEELFAAARRSEQTGDLAEAVRFYDLAIAQAGALSPHEPRLRVHRGSVLLQVGRVADSLHDFERAIALEPRQEPYLWQRGIALYYSGKFAECARQFEAHRTVNPADVENAAWHFLCVAAHRGIDSARAALLPVERDARVPMTEIYDRYAGRADRATVLAAAEGAAPDDRAGARFYAHLYLGLLDEAEGRRGAALEEIATAVAAGIEGVMVDVARLHLRLRLPDASR